MADKTKMSIRVPHDVLTKTELRQESFSLLANQNMSGLQLHVIDYFQSDFFQR